MRIYAADSVPSEASYSRLIQKISQSHVFEQMQQQVIAQSLQEGFIRDDTIVIDATHIVARDQAPAKKEKVKPEPKKRGRKSKDEQAIWLAQKQAEEAKRINPSMKKISLLSTIILFGFKRADAA